ncbi:hypothetical protein D3C72_1409190 [compost metagenome]
MTQTRPDRLLKTRAVSLGPVTGWTSYHRMMNAACRARGHARTAGLLSDTSSLMAARRLNGRRGLIEYSRARHVPETRLRARTGRQVTAMGGAPATEFISVQPQMRRAPMNRSLDWGCAAVLRLGSVGSPT